MLMTNDDVKTPRDTGLRIKTEVKAPTGSPLPPSEGPDIVCRNVNLAYGDNHVL